MPTANLALPFIEAAQAQKHVTHNEALRVIDTLVQLAVADRDLNAPPGSPAEGARFIVKASPAPTGAWAGHGNHVAAWQDGAWQFCAPKTGWVAFVVDEGTLVTWNGTAWGDFFATVTTIQNLARLGVGTTADATNPFSAKLNNALMVGKTVAEGGDGHLRYKLSKESADKTLSLLLQDNFSGRAELGLTGDDDFHLKVSADGTTWHDALRIDRASGKLSFPASGGPREQLAANRTYYVRTDGSDANNGLANTAAGAFLTIQKAIDVVFGTLDLAGFAVTIQLADGTYTSPVNAASPQVGAGTVTIKGNGTTPANVLVSTTAATAITAANGAALALQDLEIRTATSGFGIVATKGAAISFANLRLGTTVSHQLRADDGGRLTATGNYAIVGSGQSHWNAVGGGVVRVQARTITLTGTPNLGDFANAIVGGLIVVNGNTFSGSATGRRYYADSNGVIFTGGGGASYLPGDTAGTTATGGQYV